MRTSMDRIVGLKQYKRKQRLFWRVWFGNTCIDEGVNYGILKSRYEGQNVKIKGVY
jgi:hypothetical protein